MNWLGAETVVFLNEINDCLLPAISIRDNGNAAQSFSR